MDVAAIDDDVVGHVGKRSLRRRTAAECQHLAVSGRGALQLHEHQAPVMRAGRRLKDRLCVGRSQLRERPRGLDRDSPPFAEVVGARRSNGDELRAVLVREREVADVGSSAFERDRVAGPRIHQRGVQIAAGGDRNRRGRRVADACQKHKGDCEGFFHARLGYSKTTHGVAAATRTPRAAG